MAAHKVRALLIFLAGLLILLVGAGAYIWSLPDAGLQTAGGQRSSGAAQIGGPFELVDQTGAERTAADFEGRHMLIYFGYTFCPDVCPTSLAAMSHGLEQLQAEAPELGEKVVPLFITVDPERDDVAALASYAEHFHPDLVALTGSAEQIAATAKAYRVYYRKAEDESASDYLVDHSSFIYLMGPDGFYVSHFSHNAQPQEIAEGLKAKLAP